MTPQICWLAATVFMTALFWVPCIIDRVAVRGLWATISDRGPENGPHSQWGERAIKAHRNAVENLVIFAPLVLIAQTHGMTSPLLGTAAMVYFFARLAHFLVYCLGLPVLRTLTFTAGWIVQMVFVAAIFGWI